MKEEKILKMRQTDALIIADALRYLANDKERHESDRTSAKVLREKILTVFASSSGSVNVSGEVTGWIPCSERLPGKNGRYLVTYPSLMSYDLQTDVMIYGRPLLPNTEVRGKCFYSPDSEWGDIVWNEVIAWMPLPEPYKSGNME